MTKKTKHRECATATMNQELVKELMNGSALDGADAGRLILECMEGLGSRIAGKSRIEVLTMVRRVIHAGIAAVSASERTVSFEFAAWESVMARKGRRPSTIRDLRHYVRRMLRIEGVANMPLRSMTVEQCRCLNKVFGHSAHSYRKGRAILHSVFAYGMRREWCEVNPVSRIEVPLVKEKMIVPLSNEEVDRLIGASKQRRFRDMRFALSLLLYSGVRPAEVERLQADDVCWEEQQVIIRPQRSKTGGGRVVPLRILPGLVRQDCRVPENWRSRWLALRRAAGFSQWVPDVCRHTFASYHAAYFKDLPALQLEMGHRDSMMLRSRYMSPALRREAEKYWRTVCKKTTPRLS